MVSKTSVIGKDRQISSLNTRQFVLFNILRPPRRHFNILFTFNMRFFGTNTILNRNKRSLNTIQNSSTSGTLSLRLPHPLSDHIMPPYPTTRPLNYDKMVQLRRIYRVLIPNVAARRPSKLNRSRDRPITTINGNPFRQSKINRTTVGVERTISSTKLISSQSTTKHRRSTMIIQIRIYLNRVLHLTILYVDNRRTRLYQTTNGHHMVRQVLTTYVTRNTMSVTRVRVKILTSRIIRTRMLPTRKMFVMGKLIPPVLTYRVKHRVNTTHQGTSTRVRTRILLRTTIRRTDTMGTPRTTARVSSAMFRNLFLRHLVPFPSRCGKATKGAR